MRSDYNDFFRLGHVFRLSIKNIYKEDAINMLRSRFGKIKIKVDNSKFSNQTKILKYIIINNEKIDLRESRNIRYILEDLNINPDMVIVENNEDIFDLIMDDALGKLKDKLLNIKEFNELYDFNPPYYYIGDKEMPFIIELC